jgi:hypothetical protein
LIIVCKGDRKNNKVEKCEFLHTGSWGDDRLVEHEKYHRSLEDHNHFWLGFDVPQSFGSYSGRDGKRN